MSTAKQQTLAQLLLIPTIRKEFDDLLEERTKDRLEERIKDLKERLKVTEEAIKAYKNMSTFQGDHILLIHVITF